MDTDIIEQQTPAGTRFVLLPAAVSAPAPAPTLLLLAMSGAGTLRNDPYRLVGLHLRAQGWQIVSLDLPCHGADRRDHESPELPGWAARTAAGEDFVAAFQARVNDVLAHLIAGGMADPNHMAAAGTSRGGYLALQAAAGNPHLRAVAAFAPVTDLLALREFTGQEDNPLVHRLALTRQAEPLADRAVWITIGSADDRVDTDRCIAFTRALVHAATARGFKPNVILHLLATPGHASFPPWHADAADFFSCELRVES